ncbi:hypothetical protein [Mycobacterium sp. ENV421]|uniref:hypothetical protein n=1 Tax=Mycobacterium sp. ENV421 TaxID=1213407 RepID=UPI001304D7F4|nr:hypothetical protein [Mycobacterium sp. ENV421]
MGPHQKWRHAEMERLLKENRGRIVARIGDKIHVRFEDDDELYVFLDVGGAA